MTLPPELRSLRAAFVFLTRIPVGGFPYSEADFRFAPAHFPFVGLVLGTLGALAIFFTQKLGPALSSLLGLYLTTYLTGAFHEDGLADSLDGLGGAHSKKKILEILKDSRIGTYGAVALVFSMLARFLALLELTKPSISFFGAALPGAVVVLPLVQTLARLPPVFLMKFLPYASEEGAKGSSVAKGGEVPQLVVASLWSLGVAALFVRGGISLELVGIFFGVLFLVALETGRRYRRAVGGFTGDFLGMTEQLGEITLLLVATAFLR